MRVVLDTNTVVSGFLWDNQPRAIIERYSALAEIIEPAILSGPVSPDPDDDLALANALAAQAEPIGSRDKHLRNLKHFHVNEFQFRYSNRTDPDIFCADVKAAC